ncbi:MAG TPA: hypothetical protein VGU44_05600, partial [Gammaproteobacteria bacterium]|nr:hypothetical protein [Gammaproteobacteria bacterium]
MSNPTQKKALFFQFFYMVMGTALFLLPLIHAWMMYPLGLENQQTSYSALGGLIPWSDAEGYFQGANHFLETGVLNAWNTRRPLNAILFSIRLWLTNDNFRAALIIQALLCGISCVLVVKSVIGTFGKIAGIGTLFVLLAFAGFIPTTLSETLGLTLGCLAFVFLWAAIQTQKNALFFSAGLMLMVGLNARAGAFLVIPLLILWLGYYFKNKSTDRLLQAFNWKIAIIFTAGLLGGLLFNFTLIKLYADPSSTGGAMHGNFALTLYGLVSGGKMWNYAYTVFPELASKSEAELANFLYIQSFEQFKQNPLLLLLGFLRGWGGIIKGLISFFQADLSPLALKIFIRTLGFSFLTFGIWRLAKLYPIYKKEVGLLGIALLGMFLSAAGIWTDGGFRVFAVTVPFFAVAFGIVIGTRRLSTAQIQNKSPVRWEIPVAYALSYTLIVSALIGPLFIKSIQAAEVTPNFSCASNEIAIVAKNIAGAPYLNLANNVEKFSKNILDSILENKKPFLNILEPHL